MDKGIPSVSDYAHYNEDAFAMWYEENKYDMMYESDPMDDYDPYNEDRWPSDDDE